MIPLSILISISIFLKDFLSISIFSRIAFSISIFKKMTISLLTKELEKGSRIDSKERLNDALQQMFPASADKKVDEIQSLTESYHKYKREYVKHISFNPEDENLSKFFLGKE